MANVKKGQTVPSPQWWKHLRWMKRTFWKKQRKADRRALRSQESLPPQLPATDIKAD
jgi:hypothetical protein